MGERVKQFGFKSYINVVTTVFFCFIFYNEAFSQLGFPYCENFEGGGVQESTVFGGTARLIDGVLRLTDAGVEENGYVYIDIPFPSAYGLKASFEYYCYGGSGADGLTFFLFDAETPTFSPGGFGGSLGYAQRNNQPGLSRGYLGIGFDAFGNFGNSSEGKTGGFFGVGNELVPNAVVVRGPGNGLTGYPFVVGRKTMESGNDGVRPDDQFTISSGGFNAGRVTDPDIPGYRKVFVELQPNNFEGGYFLTVRMLVTEEPGLPKLLTIFDRPYYFEAPRSLKVGFAASTGSLTNIHEIDNLIVEVFDLDGLEEPLAKNIDDVASCAAQENNFEITSNEVELFNEDSEIACLQFYPSLEAIEEEDSDVCSRAKCRSENRTLELPQGVFRADNVGGKFTFFPNEAYIDDTVKVYYTVTDNYGKTSKGKYISLVIRESPDPVTLLVENTSSENTLLRKCEDEEILLRAVGDEAYFAYEWYRNGILIPDSNISEWKTADSGIYQVIAYNRNNCPAKSNILEIIHLGFPVIEVDNQIISCNPAELVDLRSYINDFNSSLYDYKLLTPDGSLLFNQEISALADPGNYLLSVKQKDLDCWSDPFEIEILINRDELIPDFDFEVDGTGIRTEEEGGIFMDDPIRFTDLTVGSAVDLEWNFGDGTISTDRSPVHVFGRRGVFPVQLTVSNELGCIASIIIEVPITLSYRVMFPTGFTPELPGNNYFRPKIKGIVEMELYIFNLWGNTVFLSKDLDTVGWDGRVNGELAPAGNYVYRAKLKSGEGEIIEESGRFTLIR